MKAYELIAAAAATPKKGEKADLIRAAFLAGERDFFTGMKLAYGAQISFGVKKVSPIDEDDGAEGDFSFAEFLDLADKLRTRKLTGHAARDAIIAAADRCHVPTWNGFYSRILLRDFKAGFSESTVNKVLEALVAEGNNEAAFYIVPTYSCQLAPSEALTYEEALEQMSGRVFVDVKYDGARLNAHLDREAGQVNLYSREGQPIENFPQVVAALEKLMVSLPGSAMLDGEITSKDFQSLMSEFGSKKTSDSKDITFSVFDIVPLDDFRKGESPKTQRERHAVLVELENSGLLEHTTGGLVRVHPKIEIDLDTPEGKERFRVFLDEVKEAAVHDPKVEGAMVKKVDAIYRCKRWGAWEKIKPVVSATLEVVELQPGKPGSKNANRVGAVLCRGVDGDREIEVAVGSGYPESDRDLWWNNPELVLGMLWEIEADSFSQNKADKGTNRFSMRFPRLKGARGTKPGEKI